MTTYIVLLIAIFLYSLILKINPNSKYAKIIFLTLSFFSFTLILGLRSINVGEDTPTYISIFHYCQNIPLSGVLALRGFKIPYFTQLGYTNTIEIGFFIWCKLVGIFTNNAQTFLFYTAGITCFLFAKFIYDNCLDDVFLPTMIFLCESPFMNSFNLVREMMACAVALQAYKLLKNNKIFKSFLVIVIAFLIHNTAIITILLVLFALIFKNENQRRSFNIAALVAIIIPIATVGAQSSIAKLFPDYSDYYIHNFYQNSLGVGSLILIVIEVVGIIYMYIKKFRTVDSAEVSILVLIDIFFQLLGTKIVMLFRLAIYFRVYLLLFFNRLFDLIPTNYRKLCKGMLLVLLIIYYLSFAGSDSRSYEFFWN